MGLTDKIKNACKVALDAGDEAFEYLDRESRWLGALNAIALGSIVAFLSVVLLVPQVWIHKMLTKRKRKARAVITAMQQEHG